MSEPHKDWMLEVHDKNRIFYDGIHLLGLAGDWTKSMKAIKDAFPYLTNLLGEDAEQVIHIVHITLDGLESSIDELSHAIAKEDRVFARNTLHRMRSSLGHMTMDEVLEVMPRSRDEDLWERLPIFINVLKDELRHQKELLAQVEIQS